VAVKTSEASAEVAVAVIQETASIASNLVTCPRIALNPSVREASVEASEGAAVAVPLERAATWAEGLDLTLIEASSRAKQDGVLSNKVHPNLKLLCGVLHLILP
jgi:hypothetical protein